MTGTAHQLLHTRSLHKKLEVTDSQNTLKDFKVAGIPLLSESAQEDGVYIEDGVRDFADVGSSPSL